MKVEILDKILDKGISVIRLVPENEQETKFLENAWQEGLRIFTKCSSGAVEMALPSLADLKQVHVPIKVVSWLNEVLREGFE